MKTEILNQITSLGLERTFLNLKMTEASLKMKMKSSTVANYSDERYHRERKCDIDSGIEDDQYHKNCIHQACHVPCLIYKHPSLYQTNNWSKYSHLSIIPLSCHKVPVRMKKLSHEM